MDRFVRFVNLMINDVTYLLDESLSEMIQISNIQHEMDDPDWANKPLQHRRERDSDEVKVDMPHLQRSALVGDDPEGRQDMVSNV